MNRNKAIWLTVLMAIAMSFAGMSIYLDGVNCTIMNSYFVNSTSKWANDTIYLGLDYEDGVFKEIHTANN